MSYAGTATGVVNAADAEQDKWLDDAIENVKKQGWFMKRALDSRDINEALKYAASMTDELRTSKLSPKNYYELYMDVTNELMTLEVHFDDEDKSPDGRSIVELYEHVQHAGNIIPRLYLLTTVASVYIKSKKAPAKDILFDLVELCRGVQHPMRGLFLRNYLSQISKDKLPDIGSEYETVGGTVKDAIEFILQNFDNMNKLWVRMQHQGAVRDRQRRETERRNLRQLVGTNLVRLSEMEGVDLETYKESVLPRVLEQIVNCKDVIAQEYLMDVIIQVFPDDFHLQTLEVYLGTLSQLQKSVNVKNIIIALMNRLSNYAKELPEVTKNTKVEMFPLFLKYSSQVIDSNSKMKLTDILELQVALVNFASSVYPDSIKYIDHVLDFSVTVLQKTETATVDSSCTPLVVKLLSLPLESLSLAILELNSFASLMTYLDFRTRKTVAMNIVEAITKTQEPLDTIEKVEKLFEFISPLLKDQDDSKGDPDDVDEFEFDQEQTKVAGLFHQIAHVDTDIHFTLLAAVRKHFGQGGTKRIQYTLPPLTLASLQLADRVFKREEKKDENDVPQTKSKKIFGFVHDTISRLSPHYPELALRLFLQASQVSDRAAYEAITYEFVAQAFMVYEDEISDSKAQLTAINLMAATISHLVNFGDENYDTLATKTTQHSAKLLRKTDQCRAVLNCANLFWAGTDERPNHRDERRVLQSLQKALKVANACMNHQVFLFVEILNAYLFFFEKRCPSIKVKFLKGLLALIEEHVPQLNEQDEMHKAAIAHYNNTLAHIKHKQSLEDDLGEMYRAIDQDDEAE